MNRMKPKLLPALLALLLLVALLPQKADAPLTAAGVLRLHILANSDSEADQALKLRVRDALLPLFEAVPTYEDARAFVLDHGAALLEACEAVLRAERVPYGVQLLLGVCDFPDRVYNGVPFPAGAYDALRVVLGDGAGHNWWCVLFPPLCIVTPDGAAAQGTEPMAISFESDILTFLRKHFG